MIEKTFIDQNLRKIELEEYLKREMENAGFTKLEIIKTPLVTRIVVNVTKPGLAIGKSGQNIRQITETIEKKFKIDNPQLEIKEIPVPELDATAMANKLKALIERGFSWRSVSYRSVRDVMDKGAQGVELILSGKLSGKGGRKRKQRIAIGYMKKVGDQTKLVDYGKASAYPKAGAIGIKMKIVRPGTVFPDKIDVIEYIEGKEDKEVEEAKTEEKKEAEEKPTEKAEPEKEVEEKAEEKPKKAKEEEGKKAEKAVKKEKKVPKKKEKKKGKTEKKKESKKKKKAKK